MDAIRGKLRESTKELRDSLKARLESWRLRDSAQPVEQAAPAVLLEAPETITLQLGLKAVPNIDAKLRAELWKSAYLRRDSAGGMVAARVIECFAELSTQELPQEVVSDIEKDLKRTMPNYALFSTPEGQQQLRSILRAYAAHDPEVGYCQGMNFVAGAIMLFLSNPAEAFAALVLLMQERNLRRFYVRSMSLLQVQLWQLSKLMTPKLCQHLESCGVVPMLYGASWLMTGFSADFPVSFSARIIDVMLTDRCHCALLKVAVSILRRCERTLRQMCDLEAILKYLKVEVPRWTEFELDDVLVDAFSKPWTSRQMTILNNTEDVETVAQGMERVMNLQEQASRCHVEEEDDEDHSASARAVQDDGSVTHTGRGGAPLRISHVSEPGGCQSAPHLGIPILAPPPSSSSSCLGGQASGAAAGGSTGSTSTIPCSPFIPCSAATSSGGGAPMLLAACRSADSGSLVLSPVPEGLAVPPPPHGISRLAGTGSVPGLPPPNAAAAAARRATHSHTTQAHTHPWGHEGAPAPVHAHAHAHAPAHGRVHHAHHMSDPRAWAVPRQPSPLLEDFARQHPLALAAAGARHNSQHGHHGLAHSISMPSSRRGSEDIPHDIMYPPGALGHLQYANQNLVHWPSISSGGALGAPAGGLLSGLGSALGSGWSSGLGSAVSGGIAGPAAAGGAGPGSGPNSARLAPGTTGVSPVREAGEAEGALFAGPGAGVAWNLYPPPHSLELPESPSASHTVAHSSLSFGARSPFGKSVQAAAAAVAAGVGAQGGKPPSPLGSPCPATHGPHQHQASARGHAPERQGSLSPMAQARLALAASGASGISSPGGVIARWASGDVGAEMAAGCSPTGPGAAAAAARALQLQLSQGPGSGEYVLVSPPAYPGGGGAGRAANISPAPPALSPRGQAPPPSAAGAWPIPSSSPRGAAESSGASLGASPNARGSDPRAVVPAQACTSDRGSAPQVNPDGPPPLQDWTTLDPNHEPDGFDELACSGSLSTQMLQELRRGLEMHSAAGYTLLGGAGAGGGGGPALRVGAGACMGPGTGTGGLCTADGSCLGSPTSVSSTLFNHGSFRSSSPGPSAPLAYLQAASCGAVDVSGAGATAGLGLIRREGLPLLAESEAGGLPLAYEAGVGFLSAISCWPGPGAAATAPGTGASTGACAGSPRAPGLAMCHAGGSRSAGGAFAAADAAAAAASHGGVSAGGYYVCGRGGGGYDESYPGSAYSSRGGSVAIRGGVAAAHAAAPENSCASGFGVPAGEGADDAAGDLAGDILRAFVAYDSLNAGAAYDPKAKLGEAMFADSPLKEAQQFFPHDHASPSHLASEDIDQSTNQSPLASTPAQVLNPEPPPLLMTPLVWGVEEGRLDQGQARGGDEEGDGQGVSHREGPGEQAYTQLDQVADDGGVSPRGTMDSWGGVGAADVGEAADAAGQEGVGVEGSSPRAGASSGRLNHLLSRQATLRYVDGIPIFDPKVMCQHSDEEEGGEARLGASALPGLAAGAGLGARDGHTPGEAAEGPVAARVQAEVGAELQPGAGAEAGAETGAEAGPGATPGDETASAEAGGQADVSVEGLVHHTDSAMGVARPGEASGRASPRASGAGVEEGARGAAAEWVQAPSSSESESHHTAPAMEAGQGEDDERVTSPSPSVVAVGLLGAGCEASVDARALPRIWDGPRLIAEAVPAAAAPAAVAVAEVAGVDSSPMGVEGVGEGGPGPGTLEGAGSIARLDSWGGAAKEAAAGAHAVQEKAEREEEELPMLPMLPPSTLSALGLGVGPWGEPHNLSGSPQTPLVARMELPHGTSVLQLAAAAAAMQASIDAARQGAGAGAGAEGTPGKGGEGTPRPAAACRVSGGATSAGGAVGDAVAVGVPAPRQDGPRGTLESVGCSSPGAESGSPPGDPLPSPALAGMGLLERRARTASAGGDARRSSCSGGGCTGCSGCGATHDDQQRAAALHLAVVASGQDICPAALQAALQASCWSGLGAAGGATGASGFNPGSPHTPLVAKMELPRGTSVLQLAHAAAAVQAALDAAAAGVAAATAGGVGFGAGADAAAVVRGGAHAAHGCFPEAEAAPLSGLESHGGTDRTSSLSQGGCDELDHSFALEPAQAGQLCEGSSEL